MDSQQPPLSSTSYDVVQHVPRTSIKFAVTDYICEVQSSPEAEKTRILSITQWVDVKGVPHRFITICVERPMLGEFHIRLDRHRDHRHPYASISSPFEAVDHTSISVYLDCLVDRSLVRQESKMRLSQLASLRDLTRILQTVTEAYPNYCVFAGNCWHFAWVIQDILYEEYGGIYEQGRRSRILVAGRRRHIGNWLRRLGTN